MDFERIKKLIKLANNNPNEHEANLAARKVCSMLKDYNFNSQPTSVPKFAQPGYRTTWSDINDMFRQAEEAIKKDQKAREDYRKSQEEKWSRTKSSDGNFYVYDEAEEVDDDSYSKWTDYYQVPKKESRFQKDVKMRKCSKCGWERMSKQDLCFMCRV